MSKNLEKNVANIESTKATIESGQELTISERLNAYLTSHAVEHYCEALGEDEESTKEVLNSCRKEEGIYWLFTQPAVGGKNSDGTDQPTREEWEKRNQSAVRVEELAGKMWYKRPFVIGDARGVRSVVAGWNRYQDAKAGAAKKVQNWAENGKTAFATMTKEEKAAYIAELQALLGE